MGMTLWRDDAESAGDGAGRINVEEGETASNGTDADIEMSRRAEDGAVRVEAKTKSTDEEKKVRGKLGAGLARTV